MKACPSLRELYFDITEDTGGKVLDGLKSNFRGRYIYLYVPRKCRRPLSIVTAVQGNRTTGMPASTVARFRGFPEI